jgi:hypothetical protein
VDEQERNNRKCKKHGDNAPRIYFNQSVHVATPLVIDESLLTSKAIRVPGYDKVDFGRSYGGIQQGGVKTFEYGVFHLDHIFAHGVEEKHTMLSWSLRKNRVASESTVPSPISTTQGIIPPYLSR